MCHVSEIADHFVKDIDKHYKVGDRVRARVVKVCIVSRFHCDPFLNVYLLKICMCLL